MISRSKIKTTAKPAEPTIEQVRAHYEKQLNELGNMLNLVNERLRSTMQSRDRLAAVVRVLVAEIKPGAF